MDNRSLEQKLDNYNTEGKKEIMRIEMKSVKKKQRKKRIFCLYGGWLVDGSGMTCIMLQIYEISKIFNHR